MSRCRVIRDGLVFRKFIKDPHSEHVQDEFLKLLHGEGLGEHAKSRFGSRGRGMLIGPFSQSPDSSAFGFDYANEFDIRGQQAIDAEVSAKALEFVGKYDPQTQWVVMLVEPKSGIFLTLHRCALKPITKPAVPKG